MKKILAVLTAMLLMMSCFGAVAEAPVAAMGGMNMTVTEKLTLDADQILPLLANAEGMNEKTLGVIGQAIEALNSLSEKVTVAGSAVQYDLITDNGQALSFAGKMDENGLVVSSSLFPGKVLTVSSETIGQLMQQVMANMNGGSDELGGYAELLSSIDFNALTEAITPHVQEAVGACMAAVTMGEIEQGEFEVNGLTYNTVTPIILDKEAIAQAAFKCTVDILQEEAVVNTLNTLGAGKIQLPTIEDIVVPDTDIKIYSNVDENGAAGPDRYVSVKVGQDETVFTAVDVFTGEDYVNVSVSVPQAGLVVLFAMENNMMTTGAMDSELSVYFMNEKPILTLECNIAMGGEITVPFEGEGVKYVPLENLIKEIGDVITVLEGTSAQIAE